MDKIFEGALKILPDYLSFLVRFVTQPTDTLRPFSGKQSIDATLLTFVGAAVALCWLITFTASLALPSESQAMVENIFARFKPLTASAFAIPLTATFVLFLYGVIFHAIALGYHRLLNRRLSVLPDDDFSLGGSIYDTLNAVFAFATLFLPVVAALEAFNTVFFFRTSFPVQVTIMLVTVCLVVGTFFVYLPLALSGTHADTSFSRAFLACTVATAVILLPFA